MDFDDLMVPVVIVAAFVLFVFVITSDNSYRKHADCSDFRSYSISNVPARCVKELTR